MGGCRIIEREYINSGNFKNWAIPQATHDWVLIVDSDERVTPELAEEINALLAAGPRHDGYHDLSGQLLPGPSHSPRGWGARQGAAAVPPRPGTLRGRKRSRRGRTSPPAASAASSIGSNTSPTGATTSTFTSCSATRVQGAQNKLRGRHAGPTSGDMLLAPPLRFLHCYIFRLGFLDGLAGLQISMLTGYVVVRQADPAVGAGTRPAAARSGSSSMRPSPTVAAHVPLESARRDAA